MRLKRIILEEVVNYLNDNFWSWFGNSKVVNPDGSPKKVFHGTTGDFSKFDRRFSSFYFADKPEYASGFATDPLLYKGLDDDPPSVLPVYLRVVRPLDLTQYKLDKLSAEVFSKIMRDNGITIFKESFQYHRNDELPVWSWLRFNSYNLFPRIQSKGYDGIFMYEDAQMSSGMKSSIAYMVFDQDQIKSATGNSGEFSSKYDITKE